MIDAMSKNSVRSRAAESASLCNSSRQTNREHENGVTRQWVLDGIKENYERAMQHRLVLDPDGKPTGAYRYEGAVANKCLELAARHLGMFTDKVEHLGSLGIERIERVIIDPRAGPREKDRAP